jgi:hypothetical protein
MGVAVLKESHADEMLYHRGMLVSLQEHQLKLKNRLDAIYIDKLDGNISHDYYQSKTVEWRKEQDALQQKIEQHQNENRAYVDDGIRLLELAQKAASLYIEQSMEEKRRLLYYVHSNSVWKDGRLIPHYRKPFDLLAVTNNVYKQKQAALPEKSDLCYYGSPARTRTTDMVVNSYLLSLFQIIKIPFE